MNASARPRFAWALLALLIVSIVSLSSHAQQPQSSHAADDEAFEAEVTEALEARAPQLVERWHEATEARESGDPKAAIAAYDEILGELPDFDHALRRRCWAALELDHFTSALDDCKAAYRLEPNDVNAAALANAHAMAPERVGDHARARELVLHTLASDEADFTTVGAACKATVALEDTALAERCLGKLQGIDAEAWETKLFASLVSATKGELDVAQDQLDAARAAGLDAETYEGLSAAYAEAESPLSYYGRRVGWIVLAWAAAAGVLIFAGFVLSRLTMREAEGSLHKAEVSARASDSWLHRAYRSVLWLCCAYYYLSVPLVLLGLVALGGALIFGLIYLGRIPIKLVVIILVIVFGSVVAVVKSLFTRPSDEDPGEPLDLDEAPGLRAVLDEVAAKVGTRPVDHVYLEPGAGIAVFERGGLLDKLRGRGERCLLLGVAVLDGLDTEAFKAILAHEYGHFSNEDTAGGNFALGVRRSIMHSAIGLAEAGAATWYNPAWLFLRGFHSVFLRISQGASRLQEVLADRWSARTYGAASFERGLRHAIAADLRFDAHANASLKEVLEEERPLSNLYRFSPSRPVEGAAEIDAQVEEVVNAEPSPFDSHPRPADRFRWVRAIAGDEPEASAGEPVWDLFADRAAIEEQMTALIRRNITAQTGIVIAVEGDETEPVAAGVR